MIKGHKLDVETAQVLTEMTQTTSALDVLLKTPTASSIQVYRYYEGGIRYVPYDSSNCYRLEGWTGFLSATPLVGIEIPIG